MLFRLTIGLQVIVLLIGGGISCLQSIHREKELNTFDYQRVTRLTSLELALGKLFGAPIMAYFIVVCFIPLAIVAAILGHIGFLPFLQVYFVLLLGCVAYHSVALLASLMLGRGTAASIILLYLILVGVTSAGAGGGANGYQSNWQLRQVSPFAAFSIDMSYLNWRDSFFGQSLPHFAVLLVLYVIFTAWFLLGVKRNVKRDPAVYEIYSPLQALCFALYLDALILGFFNWKSPAGAPIIVGNSFQGFSVMPAADIEMSRLITCLWIFLFLGMVLLRNRERVRRRVRALGDAAAGWWAALWPAPYVLGGIILSGLATVELIRVLRRPGDEWNIGAALFEVAFCAVWITRDVLYLQWMNLRRMRRPLVSAILYLLIFYVCTGIMFAATEKLMSERAVAFGALLAPSELLPRIMLLWPESQGRLIGILAGLVAEAIGFALLERQKLREFLAPAVPTTALKPTHDATILSSS